MNVTVIASIVGIRRFWAANVHAVTGGELVDYGVYNRKSAGSLSKQVNPSAFVSFSTTKGIIRALKTHAE